LTIYDYRNKRDPKKSKIASMMEMGDDIHQNMNPKILIKMALI